MLRRLPRSQDFLFPTVLEARIDTLIPELARKGYDDLDLFRRYPVPFRLGPGVIGVKSRELETPELVAARVRRARQVLPPGRLDVNPDRGLRRIPPDVARARRRGMSAGAAIVREDVADTAARWAGSVRPRSEGEAGR